MTEHSESTRPSDQQPNPRPDAPAANGQPPADGTPSTTPSTVTGDGTAQDAAPPAAPAPATAPATPRTPASAPAAASTPPPAPAQTPAPTPASPPAQTPREKPTVYRSGGAFLICLAFVVVCALAIIDLLVEGGTQDLVGAAAVALAGSVAFGYGVYPAAFATSDRLRIRNPLRTIDLPWSAATDITAKLSFIVHTEQARYTIWAIPVSLQQRRKAERVRLKEITRTDRDARRAARGSTRLSDIQIPTSRRADPIERLSYADQAIREMTDRRDTYTQKTKKAATPNTAPALKVTWAWPVPIAILVSALLVVLAAVL